MKLTIRLSSKLLKQVDTYRRRCIKDRGKVLQRGTAVAELVEKALGDEPIRESDTVESLSQRLSALESKVARINGDLGP